MSQVKIVHTKICTSQVKIVHTESCMSQVKFVLTGKGSTIYSERTHLIPYDYERHHLMLLRGITSLSRWCLHKLQAYAQNYLICSKL
jgi:hypothetical protein